MEPEGSLSHSQVPANCPYPKPARSSPYSHILLPEGTSYYPPIYARASQMAPFPQVFPLKPCIPLSSPPYPLHAPPISFFSILSFYYIGWGVQYKRFKSCGILRCVVYFEEWCFTCRAKLDPENEGTKILRNVRNLLTQRQSASH